MTVREINTFSMFKLGENLLNLSMVQPKTILRIQVDLVILFKTWFNIPKRSKIKTSLIRKLINPKDIRMPSITLQI
jgi:hypothetical protein